MGFSSQAAGSRDHDLALTRREPEDPRPRGNFNAPEWGTILTHLILTHLRWHNL